MLLLPWETKNSNFLQIFSRYGRKCPFPEMHYIIRCLCWLMRWPPQTEIAYVMRKSIRAVNTVCSCLGGKPWLLNSFIRYIRWEHTVNRKFNENLTVLTALQLFLCSTTVPLRQHLRSKVTVGPGLPYSWRYGNFISTVPSWRHCSHCVYCLIYSL